LTTLLFTDLVGSTAKLVRLGDAAWREALSAHYEAARIELERFRGHEDPTTPRKVALGTTESSGRRTR